MNDFAFIVIPVWLYWLMVVYAVLDLSRIAVQLLNQFLQWRVEKKREQENG